MIVIMVVTIIIITLIITVKTVVVISRRHVYKYLYLSPGGFGNVFRSI